MSAEEVEGRFKVTRNIFYAALSEELIASVDDTARADSGVQVDLPSHFGSNTLLPAPHNEQKLCVICKLEEGWIKNCGLEKAYGEGTREQRHLPVCSVCGVNDHSLPSMEDNGINCCDHQLCGGM